MVDKIKLGRQEAIAIGQKVYWRESPCPQGHIGWTRIGGGCAECQKIVSNKYKERNKEALAKKSKAYYASEAGTKARELYMEEKGKERARLRAKKKRDTDPQFSETCRQKNREYKSKNSYKIKQQRKEYLARPGVMEMNKASSEKWRKENADKIRIERREYYRAYMANRRKKDPTYKSLTRMRAFVRRCTEAVRGGKKYRTQDALGYTPDQFRSHIESLWAHGMSWENYGEWHIDHVRSIKSFIDSGEEDVRVINALSNLSPLWAFDNLSKGA